MQSVYREEHFRKLKSSFHIASNFLLAGLLGCQVGACSTGTGAEGGMSMVTFIWHNILGITVRVLRPQLLGICSSGLISVKP